MTMVVCTLQVCSTLSFSGASVFKRMTRGFDVVVIDEAAQAVSLSVPPASSLRVILLCPAYEI
jgi:senataxin